MISDFSLRQRISRFNLPSYFVIYYLPLDFEEKIENIFDPL